MLSLAPQRRSRPSLTPLIDVVFLLLIFFMIVSRLSVEQQAPLALSGPGKTAITQLQDKKTATLLLLETGKISLEGASHSIEELLASSLLQKDQPILLTLGEQVTFQQTITVLEALHAAGYSGAKLSTNGEDE